MADDARTTMPDDASAPRDTLAWEAANTRQAGMFALAAAVLTLAGSIVGGLALSGQPRAGAETLTVVDTLSRAAAGRPTGGGFLAAQVRYFGDHLVALGLASVLVGLGAVFMFPPLAFLFRATRARRPLHQATLIVLAAGTVGFAVGTVASSVPRYISAANFRDGADQSNSAAADAVGTPLATAADLVRDLGMLGLAVGLVLIGLNAMRVGLLTRFMGVMAMITGATLVIQLDRLGILRSFWLAAVGLLLLGRIRRPPAWATTEPVPWPTQQQIREQREAARQARDGAAQPEREPPARRRAGRGRDGEAPAPPARGARVPAPQAPKPRRAEPDGARPHPSSKKRKRKRRS